MNETITTHLADADLLDQDLTYVASLIQARDVSPVELTHRQLQRIEARDGALHSYACLTPDLALQAARDAEAEIRAGRYRGPLHGIPIALKDLCRQKNVPAAAGMTLHRHAPATHDATVVRRLRDAGAVLLGQLQMTEGAYSDHHPSITPPRNPWNADYWTGISSSGSAVATAAGLCFAATASDTGGSVRWPCAATGLTGIKPTWGRVSRHGTLELAASLDHIGVIARSAQDAAVMLETMAGADPLDPTALQAPVPRYTQHATSSLHGLRIGIDSDWNGSHVDAQTQRMLASAAQTFQDLGATLVPVQFPIADAEQAVLDWAPICAVEAAVAHADTYPSRRAEYGPVLAAVLDAGHALSGLDYQRLLLRRMALRGKVDALFVGIDALLTPVQPMPPLTLHTISTLGEQPELIAALQRYTCVFDMTGHPCLTLPAGQCSAGMPMGVQLVAAHLAEMSLFTLGAAFQAATPWHLRRPTTKAQA
ncbi:amidase [Achromobacter sp. MY14]|uniref:amidase n=1 Tax=unclassified Achromobacter TaxID=2626865 RepID=UPI001E4486C9|nr:amidase [Achromobacter sp. MY14]MCD0497500.1 amidase [Achromobacter sp. MY14]